MVAWNKDQPGIGAASSSQWRAVWTARRNRRPPESGPGPLSGRLTAFQNYDGGFFCPSPVSPTVTDAYVLQALTCSAAADRRWTPAWWVRPELPDRHYE
jgi:hypothetical protein